MKKNRILMVGSFAQRTGFSRAFMDYCHALRAVKADFKIHPLIPYQKASVSTRDRVLLDDYIEEEVTSGFDTVLVHTIPQFAHFVIEDDERLPFKFNQMVCLTTWEFSELPMVEGRPVGALLDQHFHKVIIPTAWNARVFAQSQGSRQLAPAELHIVPHAFDPEWWWAPEAMAQAVRRKQDPYTFYSIGVWNARKNPIGLLKAYFTEFTPEDDVRLIMVHGHDADSAHADIDALKKALGLDDYPPVVTISTVTDEMIRDLHWSSSCYVSATRGEGFGLPIFEALIAGATVLAPHYSGQADVLKAFGRMGYPCRSTPVVDPLLDPNLGVHGKMLWGDPDLMVLRQWMRQALDTRNQTVFSQPGRDTSIDRSDGAAPFTLAAIGETLLEVLS